MKSKNIFSLFIFFVIYGIGIAVAYRAYDGSYILKGVTIAIISFTCAIIISSANRIADPLDKAVVLRLGKFNALKGAGLFFIVSIIDTIPYWNEYAL